MCEGFGIGFGYGNKWYYCYFEIFFGFLVLLGIVGDLERFLK